MERVDPEFAVRLIPNLMFPGYAVQYYTDRAMERFNLWTVTAPKCKYCGEMATVVVDTVLFVPDKQAYEDISKAHCYICCAQQMCLEDNPHV